MVQKQLHIHPDITQASTLPSSFYRSAEWFDRCREEIFARSWHCIGLLSDVPKEKFVQPFFLLDDYLGEPLLLVRDQEGEVQCLSNVCTHRGNLLMMEGDSCDQIRCPYHGRRFDLKGKMVGMPEFKEAKNFPGPSDDLPSLSLESFGDLLFTAINPAWSFEEWISPVKDRLSWMPLNEFRHVPDYSKSYEVNAHWALYIDNYLEGFHIPSVHPGLNSMLSYGDYSYETFSLSNLQLGIGNEGEMAFDLPESSQDYGKHVTAYYFWMFPNLMFNFYPWGLQLNIVEPISLEKTRIRFETFIWQEEFYKNYDHEGFHQTEMEDEAIVESVQKGLKSRLYQGGRFSPKMEVAVHHFHQLLARYLS